MAVIPGRLNRLHLSDDGGSTFILLGCLEDAALNRNNDELDASCKDSPGGWRDFLIGFKDGTIDGSVKWDDADAGQQILKVASAAGSTIRARWRMEELTGADEVEADCLVTTETQDAPLEDISTMPFTLRLKGNLTPSAQP